MPNILNQEEVDNILNAKISQREHDKLMGLGLDEIFIPIYQTIAEREVSAYLKKHKNTEKPVRQNLFDMYISLAEKYKKEED